MTPTKKSNWRYIASIVAITSSLLSCNSPTTQPGATNKPLTLLIGGYTNSDSEGVRRVTIKREGKELSLVNNTVVARANSPSYLHFNQASQQLYSIGFRDKKQAAARVHQWNRSTSLFDLQQDYPLPGTGVCHISMNPQQSAMVTSNYGSGDLSVVDLDTNTGLLTSSRYFKNNGKGPKPIQQSPRLHFGQWNHDGKHLYAADLGTDEILVFENVGTLTPKHRIKLDAGDGPRHLAFHPSQPWVYSLNELSNTLTVFERDPHSGELTRLKKHALLNATESASVPLNAASAIRISKDGAYLYLAVRGVNLIQVFDITESAPQLVQKIHSGGHWPRDFNFSIDQTLMMVANQKSHRIHFFQRNIETGKLRLLDFSIEATNPSFVQEVDLTP